MLRALYDRTLRIAGHRHAMRGLAAVSFVESSVFPIPPDILIIPMVIAERAKAWRIALVCTAASVAGGLLGYAIGYFMYDTLGQAVLEFYGYTEKFQDFRQFYDRWGFWFVMAAGFTPFPYKVITITSGVLALNPFVFAIASLVSRGARFYLVSGLLWYFGPPIKAFIEKHLGWLMVLFFVLLFGGFAAIKYVL